MKKLKILTMCALIVGMVACNGQNDKNANDKTKTATDTRSGDYGEKDSRGDHRMDQSSSETWGKDYDNSMDISPMYGNLNMTDQQINDYESSTKSYRDRLSQNGKNVSPDNQAILVHRDSSLQSVLSPEQYKKYQDMAKDRKYNKH